MSELVVLSVDDEPHMRRVVARGLHGRGLRVDFARDGREALERLAETRYDIVITDLQMPRMDGRALCEAMQAMEGGPPGLTLVVTGMADSGLRQWVSGLTRTELFEKPVSLRRLVARIDRYLETGGATAESAA